MGFDGLKLLALLWALNGSAGLPYPAGIPGRKEEIIFLVVFFRYIETYRATFIGKPGTAAVLDIR